MDKYQKVVWSEGMFLAPQHFQQWDRYHERLLSDRLRALAPFGWGVIELDIDPDGLANGNFALLAFRGVMPDGLVVRSPDQDLPPESRSVGDRFPPSLDHLGVFIGVPIERPGGANCRLDDKAGARPTRYIAEYRSEADDNTGETPREIAVARKNLKIFFSGEETADHVTMKIAELVRTPAGNVALREGYIPPCVALSASPHLMRLTHGLLEILSAKSGALGGMKREGAEPGGIDPAKFLLLWTVNGFIPALAHAAEGKGRPEGLYALLSQLAGALTTFSTTVHPKELPPYDHVHLSKTFGELDQKIRAMIDTGPSTLYVPIPLEAKRENVWSGRVADEKLLKSSQFFLVTAGDLPEEQVREMVPRRIKVGAANELDLIVSTAMPGVRLYHTPRPPAGIPIQAGRQYFRLENYGDYWDSILRSQSVALYVPTDLKGLKLELVATQETA